MKFHIQKCPLCTTILKLKSNFGVLIYYCTAEATPHYEVESDQSMTIEHMYAFPYAVDNVDSNHNSRLYKWDNNRWSFVKEVTRLVPEPQEQLLERLQGLCDNL